MLLAWTASAVSQDVTGNLIYTSMNPPPPGSAYSWSGFTLTESGGGGLSGGDMPAYNPYVGQFMWGYTPGTINYSLGVGSVLQGTGLQIIGLQYGLEYFNQDFSRGSLSATWSLRDGTNKLLESYYHTFGYTTEGWTKFDMTKTFASPYSLANVATLGFNATGTDDRFWAGYYGPQIRDPYARLMYGVDPCAGNVLSSPTCPGFAEAMARLSPASVSQPIAVSPSIETVAIIEPTTATTQAIAPTSAAVAVTAVPSTTVTTSPSTAGGTNATALAAARRAVNEAQSVTASVLTQAQESAAASQSDRSGSGDSGAVSSTALGTGLVVTLGFVAPGSVSLPGSSLNIGGARSAAQDTTSDNQAAETSPTSTRALASMGLPKSAPEEEKPSASTTGRSPAPPAELAGGPDIAAMAVSPAGFNAYLTAQIRDVAFYPPREVYRGQRTVDNARALRGLGSDARHQEMVDQQYRR